MTNPVRRLRIVALGIMAGVLWGTGPVHAGPGLGRDGHELGKRPPKAAPSPDGPAKELPKPDLVVDVQLPNEGNLFLPLQIRVRNLGHGPAPASTLSIREHLPRRKGSRVIKSVKDIPALEPGGVYVLPSEPKKVDCPLYKSGVVENGVPKYKPCRVVVVADVGHRVPETDENNNRDVASMMPKPKS